MSRKSFTRCLLVAVTAIGLLPVATVAQEPRAEFTLVKHEQRVVRDGREGVLITVNARLVKLQDKQVRFAAYFDFDNRPLKAKSQGFRAPDGTLSIQRAEVPKYETTELNGVQLFLPYEELDLSRRAPNQVKYFVEIQTVPQPGKAVYLANSGDFFFTFPPSENLPVAANDMSGRWIGTEELQGYGELTFEFEPNGVSFMTDKDGRRQGTWSRKADEVTLTFYNGTVVYRGAVTGSSISGTAMSGKTNWRWQATKQGGTPVVVAPTPPVSTPPSPTPPPPTRIAPYGRWVGTEDLQGYGDLVMEIEQNGAAFMTDKDGRRQGTWKQESNQVTLAFYDGGVIYRGNLTETSVAGTATSGSRTWNWKAVREGLRPTPPTPPTPPQPPVAAGILGRWTGSEDLQGYGDLVMEIEQNGVAFMTDKDGRRQGAWTQKNNEVTLAFYNGTVVYRGSLSGENLSGVATNGKIQWNWRIARSGTVSPMTTSLRSAETASKPSVSPAPAKFVPGKVTASSRTMPVAPDKNSRRAGTQWS